jgi:hypothetical protein
LHLLWEFIVSGSGPVLEAEAPAIHEAEAITVAARAPQPIATAKAIAIAKPIAPALHGATSAGKG